MSAPPDRIVAGEKPTTTQLGIEVKVSRVEARVAPSLTVVETDTIDFYIIEVVWRQSLYGKMVRRRLRIASSLACRSS